MSTAANNSRGVALLQSGIPGFDLLTMGGLPKYRATLITGTAGSGKTVFATQFLAEGIRQAGDPCVFVTLEENPADIRNNMLSLGWDIACWERDALWAFVDGTMAIEQEEVLIGDYDLGGLLARIQAAVARVGARRLVLDAVSAMFNRFADPWKIRVELARVCLALRNMGVTAIITAERSEEYGEISRYGVEEFVADNVVVLRNALECELRRRTLEILKLRGLRHRRGEFPFVINDGSGIEVVPLSAIPLRHKTSDTRVSFGNDGLDRMCHGGPFRDSTTLVSGPSGAGKTLMATTFAAGAAVNGERCLFLGFEESRDQLFRNAVGWGLDFARMEDQGLLRAICEYPESTSLEDRLVGIKNTMAEFHPQRIVIDSITAIRRLASSKSFRDFIIGITAFIKQEQIPALLVADVGPIIGSAVVTEDQISTIIDSIILLRYVEIGSRMYRGVTVLKMRGSSHDTEIREFTIDGTGMHIGPPFQQTHGVLTGSGLPIPTHADNHAARNPASKGKK